MENQNDAKYRRAKEKVESIRSFYGNLFAYALVIPFLAFINYRTTSFPWVIFPALGWGLGLLGHGLHAFAVNPFFGKDWEERKIAELMEDSKF